MPLHSISKMVKSRRKSRKSRKSPTPTPTKDKLLQVKWNSQSALNCKLDQSTSRSHAYDCLINSLAGLELLDLETAEYLARQLNNSFAQKYNDIFNKYI